MIVKRQSFVAAPGEVERFGAQTNRRRIVGIKLRGDFQILQRSLVVAQRVERLAQRQQRFERHIGGQGATQSVQFGLRLLRLALIVEQLRAQNARAEVGHIGIDFERAIDFLESGGVIVLRAQHARRAQMSVGVG